MLDLEFLIAEFLLQTSMTSYYSNTLIHNDYLWNGKMWSLTDIQWYDIIAQETQIQLQKYVKGAQGIKKGGLKLLLKYPINLKVK